MVSKAIHADLHIHSTFSDGRYTPEELVDMAVANGVNLVALTDHDEAGGNARMRIAADKAGIDSVTGIEISARWIKKEIHVVGLNFDENNRALLDFTETVQNNRVKRAAEISKKFADAGYPGALEGALKYVTNPNLISRTHFAAWLYYSGIVHNWQEPFDKWLGIGRPAYVPLETVSMEDAVKIIEAAGGIPVMAHPGRYNLDSLQLQAMLDDFRKCGGNVIEVTTGSHSPKDVPVFTRIAREQKFEASTGSDFHRLDIRCGIGRQGQFAADLTPVWHRFNLKYCKV